MDLKKTFNDFFLKNSSYKSWAEITGFPNINRIYFIGGSLDFFYFFHAFLQKNLEIDNKCISFQLTKKNNFVCEFLIIVYTEYTFNNLVKILIELEKNYGFCLYKKTKTFNFYKKSYHLENNKHFFLSHFQDYYFDTHSQHFLGNFFHLLNNFFIQLSEEDTEKKILLRFLKVRYGEKSEEQNELGLLLGINKIQKHEQFNEKKILTVIQTIIPGIVLVPTSSFFFERKNELNVLYIEIKKMRGGPFYLHELHKLRGKLKRHLKSENLSQSESIYFPENEEKTFQDLSRLSQQLHTLQDLPQVYITFQQLKGASIQFNVMVAYIYEFEKIAINTLESRLPKIIRFVLKHDLPIGGLHSRFKKHALVFILEIESEFFLRQNDAIDLVSARLYLANVIEEILGPYRDCNGGLLQKQNQQLELIRDYLGEKSYEHNALLETLFYNLTPPFIQAVIPAEIAKELFFLVLELKHKNIEGKKNCIWESKENLETIFLVVKASHFSFLEEFAKYASTFNDNTAFTGQSLLEFNGDFLFCFFQRSASEKNLKQLLDYLIDRKQSFFESNLKKKIFRLNFHHGIPLTLNPQISGDLRGFILYKALFEGLSRINCHGEVELAAAEEVEVSACKTIYSFRLRPMRWSNGEKVTAYHFAFAWKKALHPFLGSSRADIFYPILNAEKAKKGEVSLDEVGIEVKNGETLIVKLQKPTHYFLELLAHPLCCPLYGESAEPLIFNGPFICVSWKQRDVLKLIRNPFYWEANQIQIDEIEIHAVGNPEKAYYLFETGQLDFIGDPFSPLSFDKLQQFGKNGQLKKTQICRPYFIYCNTSCFPLNHSKIRRALNLSIDRKEVAHFIQWEHQPYSSPIPPPFSQVTSNRIFDPETAQCLFDEGLKESGLTRQTFPKLIFSFGHALFYETMGASIANQWQRILGIHIKTEALDWDRLYCNFDHGKYQLGGMFQTPYYHDPIFFLRMFKDSSRLINRAGWQNFHYETLVHESEQTRDQQQQLQLLKMAEELLISESPVLPVLNQTCNYLLSNNVKKFNISEFGYINLKEIQIEK